MSEQIAALLLSNFELFARAAFRYLHDGRELGNEPYIEYLCVRLARAVEPGARTVFNLAPRHLKTLLGAVFLPTWLLARDPTEKIIILAYSEQIARDSSYLVRKLLQWEFYQKNFSTRLAADRTRVWDFLTTAGGSVYAVSVDGSVTGRGATVIIFDDPVAIADCANLEKFAMVNERFGGEVMSRLDDPITGRVLIIGHRLHANDLSGHVLKAGGWEHISLAMIAPTDQTYDFGNARLWRRKQGELLRPDAFSESDIARMKATLNPDFEALYQQFMGEPSSVRLSRNCVGTFTIGPANAPGIISVDPGHRAGPGHSFTVMQALSWAGDDVFLLDQWRAQADIKEAVRALRIGVTNCRPSAVLIECSGYGPTLAYDLRKRFRLLDVHLVPTDGRSKTRRLLDHIDTMQGNRIKLPQDAPWCEDWLTELEQFPHGPFDDQIDTLTQALDFIRQYPHLRKTRERCVGVHLNTRGVARVASPIPFGDRAAYASLTRGSRLKRIFPEQA
jgi:predicted phage terminase large subunit-like protein